jgi:hypothetical protein
MLEGANMDELVDRVSQTTGLEPETARSAIGIVLHFIERHLSSDESAALFAHVPGAREAATGASSEDQESASGGGLMDLANQLGTEGLGMAEMQGLGREMFAFLRDKAGEDVVGTIARAIPGLHQFM